MDLVLVMENSACAPLLWCGVSGKEIGKLPPNSAKLVELTVIGVTAGLQVSLQSLTINQTIMHNQLNNHTQSIRQSYAINQAITHNQLGNQSDNHAQETRQSHAIS